MKSSLTLIPLIAGLLLAGCSTLSGPGGVPVDPTYTAKGQDSRSLFLVIHYTVTDLQKSIKILTQQEVSAHYLLSDAPPYTVYRLVDENRRAWHSGASGWKENKRLNSSSIGIEIVHPGYVQTPDGRKLFAPFPKEQIDVLIPLVKDIVRRHEIKPERILGHGEVTPSYKEDPGPTFPWKQFAELGITPPWPDASRVAARKAEYEATPPDMYGVQKMLATHGYQVELTGAMDPQTQRVLMNFQMRYRPSNYDGQPDAESVAILWVLTNPLPASASVPTSTPVTPSP